LLQNQALTTMYGPHYNGDYDSSHKYLIISRLTLSLRILVNNAG